MQYIRSISTKYCWGHERIGLVLPVNAANGMLSVRFLLLWPDVVERIGTISIPNNVSFWPMNQAHPPHYLCNTDVVENNLPSSDVLGLAFVFYDADPVVEQLAGIAHTYRVSSCVWFAHGCLQHQKTFQSFPSIRFLNLLLSCFPSTVFSQILGLKNMLQRLLNTRTLNSRNTVVGNISNFGRYDWAYLSMITEAEEVVTTAVIRNYFLNGDELVVQSTQEEQRKIWLVEPEHLSFAQKLFGVTVGIGVRFTVPCRLAKTLSRAQSSRTIAESDTLNIVPFESNPVEMIRRGIEFKYNVNSRVLYITIRFRRCNGLENYKSHLEVRGMLADTEFDDLWPLHNDVKIDGYTIQSYNFRTRMIRLTNNRYITLAEAVNILEQQL
jgi:hypothetical protein